MLLVLPPLLSCSISLSEECDSLRTSVVQHKALLQERVVKGADQGHDGRGREGEEGEGRGGGRLRAGEEGEGVEEVEGRGKGRGRWQKKLSA